VEINMNKVTKVRIIPVKEILEGFYIFLNHFLDNEKPFVGYFFLCQNRIKFGQNYKILKENDILKMLLGPTVDVLP